MSIICQEIRWFVRIFISFPGFWVMNGVIGLGFWGLGSVFWRLGLRGRGHFV